MQDNLKTTEIVHNTVAIYGNGELSNSSAGERTIIGDNSRVRHCILGHHVRIDRNNLLMNVIMGDYSYTGPFDMLFHIKLGKFSSISYGVTIGAPEHNYKLLSTHPFIYDSYYEVLDKNEVVRNDKFDKETEIGNDVWIGCNSTILRGVHIGDGAVVGANSLVNRNVPPYAVVAGCPAKIIKYRFPKETIDKLLSLKWWDWPIEKIRSNISLFTSEMNDSNNLIL